MSQLEQYLEMKIETLKAEFELTLKTCHNMQTGSTARAIIMGRAQALDRVWRNMQAELDSLRS